MTTTVTITGSGTPIPSARRAGPGVLVEHAGTALLFDAGRSVVQRLAACNLWPTELDGVFVTHHHSDHVSGLQDLVLTRWVMDRTDSCPPLPLVAPAGPMIPFAERMLDLWEDDLADRSAHSRRPTRPTIAFHGFPAGKPTEVWSSGELTVMGGAVRHDPLTPAVGYRVTTPDGVVVITGDTRVCDEVAVLADGADVLVYEAMRFPPIEALPEHRRFILDYHADTRLIGRQAAELAVRTLVLTHLIPEPTTGSEKQAFVDDVRAGGYEGEIIVADDLDSVELGRDGPPSSPG